MLTGSISLGRLAGAALRVHWSAIVIATVLAGVWAPEFGLVVGAVGVILFFASILAHELAHTVVARRFDVNTTAIELWALGGMARLDHDPRTAKAEGWIAAAGPLASLAVGALGIGAAYGSYWLGAPDAVVDVLGALGGINVLLALFNLLP